MSKKLRKAQITENTARKLLYENAELRKQKPVFHFSTPVGWCNDPNGLSYFGGLTHLFFQYYPYATVWGPMHWGHVSTKDFVTWNAEPVAFAPDSQFDAEGCFSGTAMEDCGKHIIAYTGVIKEGQINIQNQCIAVGDGKNYTKYNLNPVITFADIPFEYDREHFRDPKIWKEGNTFFMACVIKQTNKKGGLVLFESEDLKSWKFVSIIDSTQSNLCGMWECPDIFTLDGKTVIILSPQEMKEDFHLGFHNGNNVVYMTGTLSSETHKFSREIRKENDFTAAQIDYGIDFYAPETTLLPDGRRIMIGWMQSWESYITPKHYNWSGMMTFPREIKLINDRLYQTPVGEIRNLYGQRLEGNIQCGESKIILKDSPRLLDLIIQLPQTGDGEKITLVLGSDDDFISVEFEQATNTITFDRTNTATPGNVAFRKALLKSEVKDTNLRFLIDTCSIEVFVNNGESAFTNSFFLSNYNSDIIFTSSVKGNITYDGYVLNKKKV